MRQLSPAWKWGLVVTAAAVALAILNVWWASRYRQGYPFDIDEAGYTSFGLVDYLSLKYVGLHGWWNAIEAQGTFAPLVPAITSLLVYIHPGVLDGFVTLSAFIVLLSWAAYGIGLRLTGPKLGAFAAVVTATLPGTFAFSREYIYALPTAVFLAASVYALISSDGLRRWGWSIGCGAALGLMLLSRTMAIVFVPGVLVAAVIVALARRDGDLRARALNFGLLVLTGVLVAATWYARNFGSVYDYLTNYGYGKQSKYYGEHHALISWGRFRSVGERSIAEDLFVPLALLATVGLIALAVLAYRALRPAETRRVTLRRFAGADWLSVVVVLIVGYAGLMTSRNGGNGFTLPLTVLVPPLAVIALHKFPRAAAPAVAITLAVALFNVLSTATIWSVASHTRRVAIPGFGESLPVTKGQPKAVFGLRAQVDGPETIFASSDTAWVRSNEQVVEMLQSLYGPHGEPPIVAFASRNRALTSNSVQLASLLEHHRAFPLIQLESEPDNDVSTYVEELSDSPIGTATAMISIVPNTNDFPPLVGQAHAETAARRLGLRIEDRLVLPDGRQLRLWTEPGNGPLRAR
ncbi:MAG: ArnT family glycosyltransferase [Solirubrobacterales bacterium]